MATLEILCPNGRRERVKVQPGTPLLEVIDEVCSKQGLDSRKYRLAHNKKQIDVTQQYRYSGLLNNAKLDLIEFDGDDTNAEVALALQLPDGQRLMGKFPIEKNLYDVLSNLGETKGLQLTEIRNSQQPCCIYAQTEVCGIIALKATTLRNLGLSGRAALRFSWKDISAEQLAEIERDINARLEKARKLEERRSQIIAAEAAETPSNIQAPMDAIDERPLHSTDTKIVTGTSDAQLRSVFDDGPVISAFGNHGRERSMFDPEPPKPATPPVRVESMFLADNAPPPSFGQFANFKFPEETKGKDLYQNEMTVDNVGELAKPCDREAVLYETVEAQAVHEPEEDLPDDFYEVTKEDLQIMHQDLVRQTTFTIPSYVAKRYELYERAIVRIHFPSEGSVIQACFRPTEPVFAMYKFVRQHLEGQGGHSLILYTPPRRILSESDMAETFASAGLLPAVNVYASSRQNAAPIRISKEARAKLQSPFENAKNIVAKWVTAAIATSESSMESSVPTPQTAGQTSPTEGASIRPPKWFKLK